jgi:hypothetical protein
MTELLELVRLGSSGRGTFGALRHGLVPFVLTLERPWANNEQNVSCIPSGRYICRRVRSPKFGNTFEVTNVPGRTDVLFHSGNTIEDTRGCILIGEEFSGTFDRPMLVSSQRGFSEFLKYLENTTQFDLIIYDAPPAVPQPMVEV